MVGVEGSSGFSVEYILGFGRFFWVVVCSKVRGGVLVLFFLVGVGGYFLFLWFCVIFRVGSCV